MEIYEPSLDRKKQSGTKGIFNLLFSSRSDIDFNDDIIEKLMQGMIDFHIHAAPDASSKRIYYEEEIAIRACEAGMKAVVFKCHSFPSAARTSLIQQNVDNWAKSNGKNPIEIFGGVALNNSIGGLNPHAVLTSLKLGGKFVWTPSVDASHHYRVLGKKGGIEVVTEEGNVVPALREIFEIIRDNGMILGLSHHSVQERFILIEEAKRMGIKKIVINHPLGDINKATPEQIGQMVDMGAYILVTYVTSIPNFYCAEANPSEMMEVFQRVGFNKIVGGTELTQIGNPHPTEGFKLFLKILLLLGVKEEDLRNMFATIPSRLLYG